MELRWNWVFLVILIVIIQSTFTQVVVNKAQLEKDNTVYSAEYIEKNPFNSLDFRQRSAGYDEIKNENIVQPERTKLKEPTIRHNYEPVKESDKPKSRKKRLIWVTDDGRLALPPGTSLTIAPTIALPFIRYPPSGFFSNISISLPVTIDFDKLGLTDNQNPLGVLPPVFARSMGEAAGTLLADYVGQFLKSRRKREINTMKNENFEINSNFIEEDEEYKVPELPEEHKYAFHGGERALLYGIIEDFISTFGVDGKACLLRAICEVHSRPVHGFGLLGEVLKLFFTASLSPFSDYLSEYVSAEQIGRGTHGPGECFPFYKNCPKSLFRSKNNKYSEFIKQSIKNGGESNESNNQNVDSNIDSVVELNTGHLSM